MLLKWWPILILFVVELLLAATNYRPGTYLMGWDNVMPEFNFRQAFITNIFGVWQEHRGLGLPDGMGHAANLVHTLAAWLLSTVVPQNTIRYIVQFFLHFAGMVGMLTLLKELKSLRSEEKNNNTLAFVGALFYGLNLITIQMFYTPLEAFSFHYAALPWLAYSLYRNNILLFITISLLTSPQFFIPTLLLPTTILIVAISGKRALKTLPLFLIVNAFWLLPYLYNLPTNAPVIQNAKINQMSSEEVYERNRAFGDIGNVLSMKGFMLDFEDVNAEGQPVFVMDEWKNWITQPFVSPIFFLFAFLMLFGIATIVVNKTAILPAQAGAEKLATFPFVIMWIVAFLFLANNTPGISHVMNVLRDRFPTFSEAYRFPFTKFSLLFAFAGTILVIYGISFARRPLLKLSFVTFLVLSSFPIFQGHFFYNALRVNLPKDYLTLFTFMNKQDHNGRIAYLPQPSYWSWKHYKFGYVGSGFLWYGLPQPLMDRAFDPWSHYNEQYYWKLSHALYGKNAEKLETVFEKYDIRYIILDENLRAPGHDRALFIEETKELLTSMNRIAVFGALSVYERNAAPQAFIRSAQSLPPPVTQSRFGESTKLVFSTEHSEVLNTQAVEPCGVLKSGVTSGKLVNGALRLRSANQRACISFGDHTLPHASAYRVEVTTKNVSGRPLLFAIINDTAKHVEVEAYLTGNDTFYLPPLSPDGLGYTVYFSNDAIVGETINDILRVEFFEVDYHDSPMAAAAPSLLVTVSHPNPFWYRVTVAKGTNALMLSQAYNPNWIAFSNGILLPHRLVNNWANGWELFGDEQEVVIVFWPQLLQCVGFGLFLLFGIAVYKRR